MPSVQEYDSQHSHPTNPATQQTLSPPPTSSLPSNSIPIPRTAQLASNRPRPQSMPPQTFPSPTTSSVETRDRPSQDDAANASSNPSAAASPSSRRHHREANHAHGQPQSSSSRQRSSNRILGDYTLSKTLGAGSMGKVKLATHNGTGEKVSFSALLRLLLFLLFYFANLLSLLLFSPSFAVAFIVVAPVALHWPSLTPLGPRLDLNLALQSQYPPVSHQ